MITLISAIAPTQFLAVRTAASSPGRHHGAGRVGGRRARPAPAGAPGGPTPRGQRGRPSVAAPGQVLRTEKGQHSQDPPGVFRSVGQPELVEDPADVALNGPLAEEEALADGDVRPPLGHTGEVIR